jgi:hypothetical protein
LRYHNSIVFSSSVERKEPNRNAPHRNTCSTML